MSLKAKLEAVIYASEEPVTLAQLASLFAADALEWKAEQAAALAAAQAEADEEASYNQPELIAGLGQEETAAAEQEHPQSEPVATEQVAEAAEVSEETPLAAEESVVDPEQEAKKEARQRDRDVKAVLRQLLDEIIASYESDDCGVEIREIAGGYRMATKPSCHDAVRLFVRSLKPALKLSLPALETLAVVAYKQPVTTPEVTEIRGVESGGLLGSLLARKLIATAGRKQVIGRPILYKTTKEFLLRFGLKDVSELPSMEEFEKMAAVELDDTMAEMEMASEPNADFDESAPEPEDASNPEVAAVQETQIPSEITAAEAENISTDQARTEDSTDRVESAEANHQAPAGSTPEVTPDEAAPEAPREEKQAETEITHHGD